MKVSREELANAINTLARAKALVDYMDDYGYGEEVQEARQEYADASDKMNNLLDKLYGVNK